MIHLSTQARDMIERMYMRLLHNHAMTGSNVDSGLRAAWALAPSSTDATIIDRYRKYCKHILDKT